MRLARQLRPRGYELKRDLVAILGQKGHQVLDRAPIPRARGLSRRGRVGGAGAAERRRRSRHHRVRQRRRRLDSRQQVSGIRAAVCHDTYTAHQAVEHDDMNVLCLGSRVVGALWHSTSWLFLGASFSGRSTHQRRLDKVLAFERRFSGALDRWAPRVWQNRLTPRSFGYAGSPFCA